MRHIVIVFVNLIIFENVETLFVINKQWDPARGTYGQYRKKLHENNHTDEFSQFIDYNGN